jgi:hypothetical protein
VAFSNFDRLVLAGPHRLAVVPEASICAIRQNQPMLVLPEPSGRDWRTSGVGQQRQINDVCAMSA